jgi:hypothetical protein
MVVSIGSQARFRPGERQREVSAGPVDKDQDEILDSGRVLSKRIEQRNYYRTPQSLAP